MRLDTITAGSDLITCYLISLKMKNSEPILTVNYGKIKMKKWIVENDQQKEKTEFFILHRVLTVFIYDHLQGH